MPDNTSLPTNTPSPGAVFAAACGQHGTQTAVEFDYTITDSLLSSRRKPRIPVRNLFHVVTLANAGAKSFWYETPADKPLFDTVTEADLRPEAGNLFHLGPPPELYPTTAWVQVPQGLLEDPETLAAFIDLRLIIRLCTAENQALTHGKGGVLNYPGLAQLPRSCPFGSRLLLACEQVEQMGGTADGMIINPFDFYRLMDSGTLLTTLEDNGVLIVRTRLVPRGLAIVGDFGHGAVLFDQGHSVIRFTDPPTGTFAGQGMAIMAEIRERLVINLPTNFFRVPLDSGSNSGSNS